MVSGLQWMRRRQRRFTRVILALFGLVWLQVAAIPCVAAHERAAAARVSEHGHCASAVRHHAHEDAGFGVHGACPYCPPSEGAGSGQTSHGSHCAFPHEAQVDARFAALAVPPLMSAWPVVVRTDLPSRAATWATERPRPPPRRSLSVDYCRFIE